MASRETILRFRRWILTGSVAAIAITGTLYGADLKSSQQKAQAKKEFTALSADERIAQYQALIDDWERTKTELQRKLDNFHAREAGQKVGEGDRRSSTR